MEGWEAAEEVEEPDTGLDSTYEEEEEERSGDDEMDAEEDGERERLEQEERRREEEEKKQWEREEWERRRMEMERERLGGHMEEEEGGASYPSHFYLKVPSLVSHWSEQLTAQHQRSALPSYPTGSTGGARRAWREGAHIIL